MFHPSRLFDFLKIRPGCQLPGFWLTLGLALDYRARTVFGPVRSQGAMAANPDPTATNGAETIPEDLALEIRRLAHDLSNALEIIVQTSYLLSTAELKEPASTWLGMLDAGVTKCLDINMELRKYIKAHTAP
jgi:hypothetical protein